MFVTLILCVLASVAGYFLFVRRQRGNDFDPIPKSMRGKRVLVTGASSGVGESVAYEYAKCGVRLVLAARRESELQRVVKRCKELGAEQAEYVVADMSNADDRDKVVQETKRLLGGLDHLVLVHVLYHFGHWKGGQEDMATLRDHFNVNVIAYCDIATKCVDIMAENGGGCIGVVSSMDGIMALPMGGTHTISKFALQGFFSTLRQELRQRKLPVSVTLCVLGPIATDHPQEDISFFGMYSAPVQETAQAIISGIAGGAVEVCHPASVRIAVFLHKFFPRTIERYAFYCLEKLLQPM